MTCSFSFEEMEIQKTVRKFVTNEILPNQREIEKNGCLPAEVLNKFLGLELLKIYFPEKYGGAEGSFTGLIIAAKELGYGSFVPAMMLTQNALVGWVLLNYGSDSLKKDCLPSLISLKALGGFAFTESQTGSDPKQLQTTARKVDGGWLLNGSKRFITFSKIGKYIIIFAKTGDQVSAFLVNSADPRYEPGKREIFFHMPFLDNGDIYLKNCFVPDDYVLGQVGQGFEILLKAEAMGKIVFCAEYIGLAERAIDLAVKYAKEKDHRGVPIADKFQLIQGKLGIMAVRLAAMNALLFQTSYKVDQGEKITTDSARLKILVAEDVKQITGLAMEIHGAYGLSTEFDINSLYQHAVSAQVVMGVSDIQRVIVARQLLGQGSCRS